MPFFASMFKLRSKKTIIVINFILILKLYHNLSISCYYLLNVLLVGKYLRDIHERKVKKKLTKEFEEPLYNPSKEYGGFFHMKYSGLKNRVIFGMSGYGGNSILIDPETSTIVVINSLHYRSKSSSKYHYNEKKLLIKPIKKRK